MDIRSRVSAIGIERTLFAVGAIITGAVTVLAFQRGSDDQGALFAAFAIYLGGAATPLIRDNVTQYKRTGAIALGGVGITASVMGVQSPLPVLFIVGGIAALFNLF